MIVEVNTKEEFDEAIASGTKLVYFTAPWCGPCKTLKGYIESKTFNIDIIKVDIDETPSIATKNGIVSIPTSILFDEGDVTVLQACGFEPCRILFDKHIVTSPIEVMKIIAGEVHKDQTYHEGSPYETHLDRCLQILIQAGCNDEDIQCAVYGHDLEEDAKDKHSLSKRLSMFSGKTKAIITNVTRDPDMTYDQYIDKLLRCGTIEDLLVKLCDVTCHREFCQLDGHSLLGRYVLTEAKIKLRLHRKYHVPYNNDTRTMLSNVVKICKMEH